MVHKVADADDFKAGPTCSSSIDFPYRIDVLIAQRNVHKKESDLYPNKQTRNSRFYNFTYIW